MSKKQIENNNAPFVQPNEQLDQEETKYTVARVPFYKRLFAAVIDLCFFLLVSFGLLTLCYFTVFNALGYHEKISQIHQLYAESGLYVKNETGEFLTYLDVYDENKSPMANLDEPITYFYSHDQRAILDNKLEFYNNEKIKSGFFVYDGDEIVAKEGVKYDDIRPFLEEQFDSAVYYFKSNPIYLNNSTFTYYTLIFTILILVVLSSSGFYLVVPLISKFGVTFGQMIFKFALIDKEKLTKIICAGGVSWRLPELLEKIREKASKPCSLSPMEDEALIGLFLISLYCHDPSKSLTDYSAAIAKFIAKR